MELTSVQKGLRGNAVKTTLSNGGAAFGTWVSMVRGPGIIRMIAGAGFDFVFIDVEHSDFSFETLGVLCETARICGITPIVRPYGTDGPLANRLQDLGAMGLMFHDVTSRADVERLVSWTHYPPEGVRGGTSLIGATDYVTDVPGAEVQRFINDNMLFIAQVESMDGVDHIDAVLAGGGVDVVEIGRGDLSTSLGFPYEIRHPRVLEAVDEVIAACHRHNVTAGVNCVSEDDVADMVARGVRCISYASDRRILSSSYVAAKSMLDRVTQGRQGFQLVGQIAPTPRREERRDGNA